MTALLVSLRILTTGLFLNIFSVYIVSPGGLTCFDLSFHVAQKSDEP